MMVSYVLTIVETVEYQEPFTYYEVVTSSEFVQWIVAINNEIESFHKNHIWELVKSPKIKKIVGC